MSGNGGLPCRGIDRNNDIAQQARRARKGRRLILLKREHIGRHILFAVLRVELLYGGVIHQRNTYFDFMRLHAFRGQRLFNCRA